MNLRTKLTLATAAAVTFTFLIAMGVNTVIFYTEAKDYRNKEITSAFAYFLGEINYEGRATASLGSALTRAGTTIYMLNRAGAPVTNTIVEQHLRNAVSEAPGILGAGLWFEPHTVGPKYMGPYAFWQDDKVAITWEYNTAQYDYPNQPWYRIAIPKDWDLSQKRPETAYRTEPYEDKLGDKTVIFLTLSSLIYSENGKVIGVSTVDWTFESTKKLLEKFKITPSSYAVLLDQSSGKIVYHPQKENVMQPSKSLAWVSQLKIEGMKVGEVREIDGVEIGDEVYDIYAAITENDFVLVAAVHSAEAYSVISGILLRNLLLSGATLLILAALISFVVGRSIEPLHNIITILRGIASGNRDIGERIEAKYKDEFGELANTYNAMADKIETQTKEIKDYNEKLEEKVKQRTDQLQQTLTHVQELKERQDGDYFLTTLLTTPLFRNRNRSNTVHTEFYIEQYKKFQFKNHSSHLGGDLCISGNLTFQLEGKQPESYTMFFNGDAMGKSMQGAGGALVMGSIVNAIMARSSAHQRVLQIRPEQWLIDLHTEIQRVFEAFDGSMYVSCVCGVVEDRSGLMYYFNAEHPYNVLYRHGKASYLEESVSLHKIGMPGMILKDVSQFQLEDGDVFICGSDGRDDLVVGFDEAGERIVNEKVEHFLAVVEESQSVLPEMVKVLSQKGELIDDLSLLRLTFGKSLQADPTLEDVMNLVKDKRYSDALEMLKGKPGDDQPLGTYYKAYCLGKTGHGEEAIQLLETVIDQLKNYAAAYKLLGKLHFDKGNLQQSTKYFELAQELSPGDTKLKQTIETLRSRNKPE